MKKIFTLAFLCLFTLNMYAQEPGEMNTDFGTDGIVVFHPSEKTKLGYFDYIYKVLVQEDGKILTIGETRLDGSNFSIFVARHNADGSLDETYGTNGYVFLKVDPLIYKSCPYDAVLSEDGLLYLAGYSYNGLNRAFILCLDENGFENEEYGEKGWVVTADGDYGGIAYEAIDLDSEGRCVVAGYYNDEVMVRRYTTGGELDATFGTDGIAIFELDSDKDSHSYAYDLKVLEDGKIIVCGDKRSGKDGQLFIWSYLMRINSDGSLDETFGDKGVSLLYAGEYAEFALSLAVQPNGKYLVGGHDELYSNTPEMPRYESFITRVNTDGTIDETFGTEGFVKIEPLQGDGRVNYSYSILAAPDGQIFGGIYSRDIATESFRAYVYNLDENGQFKEDFVGGGIMSLPKIDEELCELNLYSIALQGNDKLIVGGYIGFDLGDYTKLYLASIKVDVKEVEDGNEGDEDDEDGFAEMENATFKIHPNPASSTLFIETSLNENAQVSIIDLTGRCVKEVEISNNTSAIDIEDIERGVYFVEIQFNDNRIVEKLVVK